MARIMLNETLIRNENIKMDKILEIRNELKLTDPELYYSNYEYADRLIEEKTHNEFINTFLTAYNNHLPIKIRPDDIQLMLQITFSTCVNNNAEKMRNIFVEHKDKISLKVESNIFDINFFCMKFKQLMNTHIKDKTFCEKFTTSYTTTNTITQTVSNMLLMNTLKEYFSFEMILSCGIPCVILDGTKEDWIKLNDFYEYMKNIFIDTELHDWFRHFDIVMKMFQDMRRDEKATNEIKELWERVISYVPKGSGGDKILGGWVRLFVPYSSDNKIIKFPTVIKCLDILEQRPEYPKSYSDQTISEQYYIAEGWNSMCSGITTTPATLIDYDETKYNVEINSGFFNPCINDQYIVCFNIGYNLKSDTQIIKNEKKEHYLKNGVKVRDKHFLDIPRKYSRKQCNEILKIFDSFGYSTYGDESEEDKLLKKEFIEKGVIIKNKWKLLIPLNMKDRTSEISELFDISNVYYI